MTSSRACSGDRHVRLRLAHQNRQAGKPLHLARSGRILENKFRINIKCGIQGGWAARGSELQLPDLRRYSRAYLRHLYSSGELSYFRLATLHNLHFMLSFMEEIRESINKGTLMELKKKWLGKI